MVCLRNEVAVSKKSENNPALSPHVGPEYKSESITLCNVNVIPGDTSAGLLGHFVPS